METNNGTITYQYDALNQLTKETLADGTTITYEYDAVGNRTKKIVNNGTTTTTTYTYDAADQLTAVNGQAYTYDANGNLTNNGNKTFVYDDDNRLIEVKNVSGTTIASFTYDQLGRRISKTTSNGTIYYHYDGDSNQVLYETDANNNIVAEYTWDAYDHPITMTKGGVTYYYHVNGHGDVTALTDASGNVVAEYQYDAWGNILSKTGAMASANPYRYAGYYYDEETGLYYLMARYYDANIGRFITRDTFHGFEDDPQSLNQYAYGKNNPVTYIDPSGHISINKRVQYALKYAIKFWLANYIGWDNASWIFTSIWAGIAKGREAYKISYSKSAQEAVKHLGRSRTMLQNARKIALKVAIRAGLKAAIPISAVGDGYLLIRGFIKGWNKYK
ncbi:RHS repeat-associated protein [Anoxybacillus tepidamans]|uniref:RHS repeat-associated protein n=2 Tax=Anoxybacillaceae TaxID=3120669 RepID=A0A7W8IQ35_9BACL|nr:RHS repeat-associated protein [Anoxybacillus tepidamans]